MLEEKEPFFSAFQIKLRNFWEFFIMKTHVGFYAN